MHYHVEVEGVRRLVVFDEKTAEEAALRLGGIFLPCTCPQGETLQNILEGTQDPGVHAPVRLHRKPKSKGLKINVRLELGRAVERLEKAAKGAEQGGEDGLKAAIARLGNAVRHLRGGLE